MRAVSISEPGGPDLRRLAEGRAQRPGPGKAVVEIAGAGVTRADLMQRMGLYPPPPGAPPYPGLECSGRIAALGEGVDGWEVGDQVCALLSGGGYAEKVAVPAGQLLPVPAGVSLSDAAGLPEVTCTVRSNVFQSCALQPGETLLVHGGASGIGTMAIQLAREHGARVACTAGTPEKLDRRREAGADLAVNYNTEDFVGAVRDFTGGRGADVSIDLLGA